MEVVLLNDQHSPPASHHHLSDDTALDPKSVGVHCYSRTHRSAVAACGSIRVLTHIARDWFVDKKLKRVVQRRSNFVEVIEWAQCCLLRWQELRGPGTLRMGIANALDFHARKTKYGDRVHLGSEAGLGELEGLV